MVYGFFSGACLLHFFLKDDYHGSDHLSGLSLSLIALGSLAQSPSEIGYALIQELALFSLPYQFEFSARTGLVLAIASLGCLFAAPTQGALLSRSYLWIRPIAFSSVSTLSLMLNPKMS